MILVPRSVAWCPTSSTTSSSNFTTSFSTTTRSSSSSASSSSTTSDSQIQRISWHHDIRYHLSSQNCTDKPSSGAFLGYVATLLARADLRSTDLGSLRQDECDPSYYSQPVHNKIRFYILPIPALKSRAGHADDIPPEVRRAVPDRSVTEIAHVGFVHATARSNFVQILKEGKLAESKLQSDSESFFAKAYKLSYTDCDNNETARIAHTLHTAWNLAKNEARVLLLGLAWGTAETVHQGGEGRCIELRKGPQGGCVHHKNGTHVGHCYSHSFFESTCMCGDLMLDDLRRCLDDSPSSSLPCLVFLADR